MRSRTKDRSAGVVLVLTIVVVSYLSLLSALFTLLSGAWRKAASSRLDAVQAELTASAGLEYAACRIRQLGSATYPRWSASREDRGDDWLCREPLPSLASVPAVLPSEELRNPSFAHGDRWDEGGTADGVYDASTDLFLPAVHDVDGDGRFTARTGRLRSDAGPFAGGFSLRIESIGSKLPVNYRTASPERLLGMEVALNNLGGILFDDDGSRPWRRDLVTADGLVRHSSVGTVILGADGGQGGYRRIEEVALALAAAGYASADIQVLLPYLEVGPYESEGSSTGSWTRPTPRVEMATASRDVLRSLWTYASFAMPRLDMPPDPSAPDRWNLPYAEPAGWTLTYPRTLSSLGDWNRIRIYPDEAIELAELTHLLRASGRYGWKDLREEIARNADPNATGQIRRLFKDDCRCLDLAGYPNAARAWVRAKGDLAFFMVSPNTPPFEPLPTAWGTWGAGLDLPQGTGLPFSIFWNGQYSGNPRSAQFPAGGGQVEPVKLTTGPPSSFRVRSRATKGKRGASAGVEGVLRSFERLEFHTQSDFENLSGFGGGLSPGAMALSRLGIRVSDPLGAEKMPFLADPDSGRIYRSLTSYPVYNWCRSTWMNLRYSDVTGGVALAGKELGNRTAKQYWTFPEIPDPFPWAFWFPSPSEPLGGEPVYHFFAPNPFPLSNAWSIYPGNSGTSYPFDPPPSWLVASPPCHQPGVGPYLDGFTLEGWMFPQPDDQAPSYKAPYCSLALLSGKTTQRWDYFNSAGFGIGYVDITLVRRRNDAGVPGVWCYFFFHWGVDDGGSGQMGSIPFDPASDPAATRNQPESYRPADWLGHYAWFIPDGSATTGHYHVAVTAQWDPAAGKSRVCFYVNGQPYLHMPAGGWLFPGGAAGSWRMFKGEVNPAIPDPAPPFGAPPSRPPPPPYDPSIHNYRTDEIRLYDRGLSQAEVQANYSLGRFFRPSYAKMSSPQDLLTAPLNPTYRSHIYHLPEEGSLLSTQWTGFGSPGIDAQVGMRMVVFKCDPSGAPLAWVEVPTASRTAELSALGPVRSFRYAVEFYDADPPPVPPVGLLDTPVLESVRFDLRCRTLDPAWTSWRKVGD